MPGFIAPLELEEELLWPDEELELLVLPELDELLDDELEDELLAPRSVAPQLVSAKL